MPGTERSQQILKIEDALQTLGNQNYEGSWYHAACFVKIADGFDNLARSLDDQTSSIGTALSESATLFMDLAERIHYSGVSSSDSDQIGLNVREMEKAIETANESPAQYFRNVANAVREVAHALPPEKYSPE